MARIHNVLIALALRAVHRLPPSVRAALDAWSLRVARGRALRRQRAWQSRT